MEIHLMINDVIGIDDEKRHILRVDDDSLRRALCEREKWLTQEIIRAHLMKHPALMSEIVDDPQLRNIIYMQEKAKREQKAENRKRMKQAEIDKQRRREQFLASSNYRKSVDYIHGVLGWNNEE